MNSEVFHLRSLLLSCTAAVLCACESDQPSRHQAVKLFAVAQDSLAQPASGSCKLVDAVDPDLRADLLGASTLDIVSFHRSSFDLVVPTIMIDVKGRKWPEQTVTLVVMLEGDDCGSFMVVRNFHCE